VISFIGKRDYAGSSAFLGTYCCNLVVAHGISSNRLHIHGISSNRLHIHGIYALSLPCRDDGSDSAADAYANQLVAGDEQEPYDVL